MCVGETATGAGREGLKALWGAGIAWGAGRLCLADTVGHATPDGVRALVSFVKKEIVKQHPVKIDWHGHRDRGMGLINCLAAIEAGGAPAPPPRPRRGGGGRTTQRRPLLCRTHPYG